MLALAPVAISAMRAPVPMMNANLQSAPVLTPVTSEWAEALPGVTSPFGLFDPFGLAPETQEEYMLFREAELAHGRVAMMAALGFLVQEKFHPIFDDNAIGADTIVIRHLDKVLEFESGQAFSSCLLFAIFLSEFTRARIGWEEPDTAMRTLRDGYAPGDLKFDPLGMMPKEPVAFKEMQNKELNNGRLAMMAVAGMTAQELVTNQPIF
jgi:light-harvesting complex I chlorophyll a/b binding protein 1